MLYIFIFLLLLIIDQITKHYMYTVSQGQIGYSIPVIKDFFHITYVENHGGIFGLYQGKINIFTIVSVILIIYVVITEYKNFSKYSKPIKIGISIIAAGAAGNMTDRIFRNFVIDMIDFRGIWHFVFNVADTYIHIGLYIIVAYYLIEKYKKVNKK